MVKIEDILEQITDEIVIDIMAENGSPVMGQGKTFEGKGYLIFRTICHGGDSNKLYYYSDSKTFHCWTNCGTMSFFDCISKIRGYSSKGFRMCLEYVAEKVGINLVQDSEEDFYKITSNENKDRSLLLDTIKACDIIDESSSDLTDISKIYDCENLIKFFQSDNYYYKGWIDEGISIDTMKKFEVGWYDWNQWIILPCRNVNGELIGIRRRALDYFSEGEWKAPKDKYKPLDFEDTTYSFPTSRALYGIYQNHDIIQATKRCILFEGEKSVMKANTMFGEYPSVAVYGSSVSDWQIQTLIDMGVNKIYLAFDKDYDYNNPDKYGDDSGFNFSLKKRKKIVEKLSRLYNFEVYIIGDIKNRLGEKDSPIDRGKETYEYLFNNATTAADFLNK